VASVVVPAHDEEAGLRRCLEQLLATAAPDEFDVVVVANGCTDGTAGAARDFADRGVRCVELAQASKAAALRAGDAATTVFPRIYLDADVTIGTATARALAAELAGDRVAAAAPRLRLDLSRSSRPARMYLRVWQSLPVFDRSYVGSGCYALSAAGRSRFGEFPDVMSDDQFVNDLFDPAEKTTLRDHPLDVTPPATLRHVVRRSLRVRAGRLDLAAARPQRPTAAAPGRLPGQRTGAALVWSAARSPRTAPDAAVFVATQAVIALVARLRRRAGRDRVWLRDDSSRPAAPAVPRSGASGAQ
jgi:hypothetical protein